MQIITLYNDIPVVSHRVIAENTGNEQRSIRLLIDSHLSDFEEFGQASFEMTTVKNSVGALNKEKTYLLNEQQATLLLTYLKNTKIVREFKKALVKEFYALKVKNHSSSAELSKLIYQLERENIELKRAVNRITSNQNPLSKDMNDFLDFIGYMSRATKTLRELAGTADYYANTGESFLSRISERYKNNQGVQEQCKRLPKHQIRE
jgi:phage regulator Rha-like protein